MRTYQSTHPWLTFNVDLASAPHTLWMLLGEARSKCDHLASIPLRPDIAKLLHTVYLAKGAAATTAIEGNTLSEEQVRQRIGGQLELPPSQEYLGREIDNIVEATSQIWQQVSNADFKEAQQLTVEEICRFNEIVLEGTQYADYVVPGKIRESLGVSVGPYRGAPAEDCQHLLEKYCTWLNDFAIQDDDRDMGVTLAIIKAVIAHVYFEWIHPFGDGNGRVGRLIEVKILVAGGVPTVAAHLLSNHYNITRAMYVNELQRASQTENGVVSFLQYAVGGFVEQLVQQIDVVFTFLFGILWRDLVHSVFRKERGKKRKRQRDLMLTISEAHRGVDLQEMRTLSGQIFNEYKNLTERTVLRDVTELRQTKLLIAKEGKYFPNYSLLINHFCDRRIEVPSRYLSLSPNKTVLEIIHDSYSGDIELSVRNGAPFIGVRRKDPARSTTGSASASKDGKAKSEGTVP